MLTYADKKRSTCELRLEENLSRYYICVLILLYVLAQMRAEAREEPVVEP
jgi:hypothetical protein